MRVFFAVMLCLLALCPRLSMAADLAACQQTVKVNGAAFTVKVVRVPLDAYRVRVGLARGKVGATQSLAGIAADRGAVAAINGSFFDAYTKDPIKPPYHHLITGGELAHLGNTGTTLGFDADGQYRMERVTLRLRGQTGRASWYAFFLNHPATSANAAILYTRLWVGARTPAKGRQVTVQDGAVRTVADGAQALPANGYVAAFTGGEAYQASRFQPGAACSYRLAIEAEDVAFWERAREALGCGPRLVKAGELAVDPRAEGFSHPKILSMACQRSAVGVTRDHTLLLVTCPGATIPQLAAVMRALGAHDAINLDGGASSSLWLRGRYLTPPGRDISNALLVVAK